MEAETSAYLVFVPSFSLIVSSTMAQDGNLLIDVQTLAKSASLLRT
jgi:hypothetical protein